MPTTIAFINLKGGVAKTTTAVATAQILSGVHRKKVLLIDLDPQTNATVMLVGDARWKKLNEVGATVAQLFQDAVDPKDPRFDAQAAIQHQVGAVDEVGSVSLLPSSLDLIRIQDKLVTMPMGQFQARTPIDILHRAIRDKLDEFDFILIDCPPSLGLITLNGLRFADGYVIPTIPDVLSTYGIPQIITRVAEFAEEIVEPIEPLGILATKFQTQQVAHRSQLRILRQKADAPVFDTVITQGTELSSAAEYVRKGTLRQKWGYQNGFPLYSRFVKELLQKLGSKAVPV
jgi:chromosome partitioning protein